MIREYHVVTSFREGRALKRGAVHYGPHFDYTTFAVSKSASTPPPEYLTRLLDRLPARDDRDIPDQYTLQHYPPGTGIPPHVDTHSTFEETIYSLSFGASTRMDFKLCGEKESRRLRLPKRSLGGGVETPPPELAPSVDSVEEKTEEWELELPARSLLVMRGPSRYGYTHGIKGRKHDQDGARLVARQDRYSLTMRRIKLRELVVIASTRMYVVESISSQSTIQSLGGGGGGGGGGCVGSVKRRGNSLSCSLSGTTRSKLLAKQVEHMYLD